jgi:hypothetical protein
MKISQGGVRKFLAGSQPHPKTMRKLLTWYFETADAAPVTDEPALAAINLLVNGSPERERENLRARLLDLLREAYGASGQKPPEWLK